MSGNGFMTFLSNPAHLPIIAVLAGCSVGAIGVICGTIQKIVKIMVAHRERMAKIAQGIDPDWAFRAEEPAQTPFTRP